MTRAQELFHDATKVERVGNKSLWIVHRRNVSLLVSYQTVVGFKVPGSSWCITDQYYSVTTTRQTNGIMKEHGGVRVSAQAWERGYGIVRD